MTPALTGGSSTSPTRAVLGQVEGGTGTVAQIAAATGLDVGVVGMALDRLLTSGHLHAQQLQTACPEGSCRGCPAGDSAGPGCSAATGNTPRGPVLLTLATTPR